MDRGYAHLKKLIASNMRQARKVAGISQEELAFRAEVDRTYVSQIERAVGNPSLLILYKLGKALRMGPAELLMQRRRG